MRTGPVGLIHLPSRALDGAGSQPQSTPETNSLFRVFFFVSTLNAEGSWWASWSTPEVVLCADAVIPASGSSSLHARRPARCGSRAATLRKTNWSTRRRLWTARPWPVAFSSLDPTQLNSWGNINMKKNDTYSSRLWLVTARWGADKRAGYLSPPACHLASVDVLTSSVQCWEGY